MLTLVPIGTSVGTGKYAAAVSLASQLLCEGHIIALPTDTIYGLACNAQNTSAIQRLYSIKGRNCNKPLAICVGEVEDVKRWGVTDMLPKGLLTALLPGPVTIVLKRTEQLNPELNPSTPNVGIRIPNHQFVREVVKGSGGILALTSANLSNQVSSLCPEEFRDLWPKLSAVFDGGAINDGICRGGSTIVDLTRQGSYSIIRDGSALSQTIEVLERYGLLHEKLRSENSC